MQWYAIRIFAGFFISHAETGLCTWKAVAETRTICATHRSFALAGLSAQGEFLALVLWSSVLVVALHLLCNSHDFPEEVVVVSVRVHFSIHRPDN